MKAELEAIGFTESSADPGLFIKPNGDKPIYLLIYVDDICLFTKDTEGLISTKAKITETFEARDLGPSMFEYILTDHMVADALTKPLPASKSAHCAWCKAGRQAWAMQQDRVGQVGRVLDLT